MRKWLKMTNFCLKNGQKYFFQKNDASLLYDTLQSMSGSNLSSKASMTFSKCQKMKCLKTTKIQKEHFFEGKLHISKSLDLL